MKAIRLSYHDRVLSAVPEEMGVLMPPAPAPTFLALEADTPGREAAQRILDAVRAKESIEGLTQLLENVSQDAIQALSRVYQGLDGTKAASEMPTVEIRAAVLVEAVLSAGSKSLSHVLNVIERYLTLLQTLNTSAQSKLRTVHVTVSFWEKNEQCQVILLDKMRAYRIIDNSAIVNWIFSETVIPRFSRFYVWEVLDCMLNKMIARGRHSRARHSEAEKDLRTAQQEAKRGDPGASEHVRELQTKIESLKSTLSSIHREQKETMLMLFQRFISVLSAYFLGQSKLTDDWGVWAYGRFVEMACKYHSEIAGFASTLKALLFTPELDPRIARVFQSELMATDDSD